MAAVEGASFPLEREEELGKLKEKLKEEEANRLAAEAWAAEKDELLRRSSLALLGNLLCAPPSIITLVGSAFYQ